MDEHFWKEPGADHTDIDPALFGGRILAYHQKQFVTDFHYCRCWLVLASRLADAVRGGEAEPEDTGGYRQVDTWALDRSSPERRAATVWGRSGDPYVLLLPCLQNYPEMPYWVAVLVPDGTDLAHLGMRLTAAIHGNTRQTRSFCSHNVLDVTAETTAPLGKQALTQLAIEASCTWWEIEAVMADGRAYRLGDLQEDPGLRRLVLRFRGNAEAGTFSELFRYFADYLDDQGVLNALVLDTQDPDWSERLLSPPDRRNAVEEESSR